MTRSAAAKIVMWAVLAATLAPVASLVLPAVGRLPAVSPASALALGVLLALVLGNPAPAATKTWSRRLLQVSVVGLGFGVGVGEVVRVGSHAIGFTVVGIVLTMLAGVGLGALLRVEKTTAALVSAGTAICGGSAIAAVAPAIRAKDHEIAVALATVFTLNAIGLVVFPPIGHALGMDQRSFGVWAALAIHDTSSVVGATTAYGDEALAVGTVVKLARALWILPMALVMGWLFGSRGKPSIPWFLAGFVAAATLRTLIPEATAHVWDSCYFIAKRVLVATLFLVGAGLTRRVLAQVGARPLALGVLLWVLVSVASLAAVRTGVVAAPEPRAEAADTGDAPE